MLKKEVDLKIDFNDPTEFSQLWNDMTQKLPMGREAYEHPSTCYVLRSEKYDRNLVCMVVSKHLDKKSPNVCRIVDNKPVKVKRHSNGLWDYPKILDKVIRESGFSDVRAWLDNWKGRTTAFQDDKEYEIWLIKLYYPHANIGTIRNKSLDPIPSDC
jgi:hypothetical protein